MQNLGVHQIKSEQLFYIQDNCRSLNMKVRKYPVYKCFVQVEENGIDFLAIDWEQLSLSNNTANGGYTRQETQPPLC